MDYPIYINAERAGTLSVERQGLYTFYDAHCADPGRLIRLSVFGAGRESVLGVMMPENGELRLLRHFSRRALEDFPDPLEYAAPCGEGLPEPEPERAEQKEPTQEPENELIWYSRSNGSLETDWQGQHYVAVPLELCAEERERMLEERSIEGRLYGIFAGKSIE